MKVYISGKITGCSDYLERFAKAEDSLRLQGHTVINPAKVGYNMPIETTWEEYMRLSIVMLDMCDTIYMLDGWEESRGAKIELAHAIDRDMRVMIEPR